MSAQSPDNTSAYSNIMGQLLRPAPSKAGGQTGSEAGSGTGADAPPVLSDDPLVRVRGARNPLLEAASTLLRALAELPDIVEVEQVDALRQALVREVQLFQSLCDRAGLRREHVVTVRYCLCTALDEAVYTQEWAREGDWAASSLLLLFHNETSGGEKFFLLLGRMAQASGEHLHALEVLYRILSLGFEGRYALSPDGMRQLETIHRRLLSILAGHIPAPPPLLSAHWQGAGKGRLPLLRNFPVWITASVLGLGLTVLFLSLSAQLDTPAKALEQRLHALAQMPLTPTPSKRPLPLSQWFSAAEKARYGLTVDEGKGILRFTGSTAFNGADIVPAMLPALDKLARMLTQQGLSGRILIVGHTDDTPLRAGSKFRNNQHLSEARAQSVARALAARGIAPARMGTEGRGDTAPLVTSAAPSARDRARNRRVDIIVLGVRP